MSDTECDLDALTSLLGEDDDEVIASTETLAGTASGTPVGGPEQNNVEDPFGCDDFEDGLDLDALAVMLDEDTEESTGLDQGKYKSAEGSQQKLPSSNDGKNVNVSSLGLDMSDDENDDNNKPKKKSLFSAAFPNLKKKAECSKIKNKSREATNSENLTSNSTEVVDPLEQELRSMEQRMNELKAELAKKKKIDLINPDGTARRFTMLTNHTHMRGTTTTKQLTPGDKAKMLQRLRDNKTSVLHSGDTDSEDDEDNRNPFEQQFTSYGRELKKSLAADNSNSYSHRNKFTSNSTSPGSSGNTPTSATLEALAIKKKAVLEKINSEQGWQGTAGSLMPLRDGATPLTAAERDAVRDPYSGIYVVNPAIAAPVMAERMQGREHIILSTIPLHLRGGEMDLDWVTIAVLVSKGQPKTSQKGSQYSIWQLSDLRDCTKTVGLFLFAGAHSGLWKTAVGSVVGVLNPQIMKDREGAGGDNMVTLSVNNPLRVMLMGTARDLGWCKGRTKAGATCRQFVNKSVCEFCIYHVQREYQKTAAKRADIQSSFSRGGPKNSLKQKVLGKDQVFYGGNLYSAGGAAPVLPPKQSAIHKAKDLARLSSLKLKLKSSELKEEDRQKSFVLKHLSNGEIAAVRDMVNRNDSLGERLLAPTPGARNLLRHKTREDDQQAAKDKEAAGLAVSLSAKDLLKITRAQLQERKKQQQQRLSQKASSSGVEGRSTPRISLSAVPTLGRGLNSGDDIELDVSPKPNTPFDPAKAKALAILKRKGEVLKSADKNNIRNKDKITNPEFQNNIKKRLLESLSDENGNDGSLSKKSRPADRLRPTLGMVDLNADKIKAMLEKKSRHSNLVDAEDDALMDRYYMKLESKEKLEEKMASIMEVPTNAVVCKICRYQSVIQSQFCKDEGHIVKSIKASKRFFECSKCKRRTVSLEKMPVKSCSNCDGGSWKRVAMWKTRKGPTLDSEVLCLRGNEQKYYGGATTKAFLHIDG